MRRFGITYTTIWLISVFADSLPVFSAFSSSRVGIKPTYDPVYNDGECLHAEGSALSVHVYHIHESSPPAAAVKVSRPVKLSTCS